MITLRAYSSQVSQVVFCLVAVSCNPLGSQVCKPGGSSGKPDMETLLFNLLSSRKTSLHGLNLQSQQSGVKATER